MCEYGICVNICVHTQGMFVNTIYVAVHMYFVHVCMNMKCVLYVSTCILYMCLYVCVSMHAYVYMYLCILCIFVCQS